MLYKFRDTTPINTDPVTATGEIVTVDASDEITDLVGVVASIEPIQSGSGTPSPANIRPISGHTECITYVSPTTSETDATTYTTDLGRTVYGGTLDVVSGVLNVTHANIASYNGETLPSTWISDRDVYSSGATPTTGAQVVYKLSSAQTYQLTAQEMELLIGQNNLWVSTGDVSVTTKKTIDRVWLPSEAVSVDGQYLENVVDGYRTLYTQGRESLEVELDTYSVGTADGETYKSKRYPARTIKVGFQLIAPDNWEFRRRFNQLNNLLSLDEADFIFNDETDKFFAGIPRFNCEVDAGENSVKGEWEIYCAYPFKRTVEPVTLTMADAVVTDTSATFTIDYKGGQPARPVLRATFAGANSGGDSSEDGDCGFVAFLDEDENIIQLGNPDVIDRDQYASAVNLINKSFVNTTGWTASGTTVKNIKDTYWMKGKGQTQSYASLGSNASLSKATDGAVNLKVSLVHRLCVNSARQTGTFGVRAKDANGNIVCGFQIRKIGNGTTAKVEYIVGGSVKGSDNIDISYYNTHFGYCKRTPVYVKETYQVPTTQTTRIMVKVGRRKKKKKYKTISKTVWVKKVRTVQKGWNYTQSNLNSMLTKKGDSITFKIGNLPSRTYKAPTLNQTVSTTLQMFGTGNFNTNAVHSVIFRRETGAIFAEQPNVFTAGDVVEADCNDATVQIYRDGSVGGSLEPQYGALGNDWENFKLHNGYNVIRAVWSDWVNPTYKPSIEIEYNEVFI